MMGDSSATMIGRIVDLLSGKTFDQDVLDDLKLQMTSKFDRIGTRLDSHETQLQEQKLASDLLAGRVATLERKLKNQVYSAKKRDIAQVRNSIIVRSSKPEKDIRSFVAKCIDLGGWANKVPPSQIALVELTSPPAKGSERVTKVFRALLQEGQKGALFKGLSKNETRGDVQIRIDNDCPLFAQQAKRDLEQLSFALRSKFATSDKLRTKIMMSNQKLKLRLRVDGGEWMTPDDARCESFLDAPMVFRPSEVPALVPSCREFYKKILEEQE